MKRYRVKEIFWSLQGEGRYALWPAVFVRFAGCNLWSGKEDDRQRDAERNQAVCPLFCDTDFIGGEQLTAREIITEVSELGAGEDTIIVLTGGEPLLQIDGALVAALKATGAPLHVETNGTVYLGAGILADIDWICISPKTPPEALKLRRCNELKVILPRGEPLEYAALVAADFLSVQPEDGDELEENIARCVEFVRENPKWKMSLQAHKLVRMP